MRSRVDNSRCFLLIVLCLCCTAKVWSDDNLDSLLDRTRAQAEYADASVLVLFDRESVTLDDWNHVHRHRELLWKAGRAAEAEADLEMIRCNAATDTLLIEAARIRTADGAWTATAPDHDGPVGLPAPEDGTSDRRMIECPLRFSALPAGGGAYVSYRIEPKLAARLELALPPGGIVLFGGHCPCFEKTFVLDVPMTSAVRHEVQNGTVMPRVAENEGRTTYTWTMKDCPSVKPEPHAVGIDHLVPRLLWTTFHDWEDLGLRVSEIMWEKVDSSDVATGEMLTLLPPELQGRPALMNIALWVQLRFHNVGVGNPLLVCAPRSADGVWQSGYGMPLEKTILLMSLLRMVGFAPLPVLVQNELAPFSALPVLDQFHHVVVAVPTDSDTLWLDPTATEYPPGTLPIHATYGTGCMLTNIAPMLLAIPTGPAADRGATNEIRTDLSADGTLSGFVVCSPVGDNAAQARRVLGSQDNDARQVFAQEAARGFCDSATVTELLISDVADLSEPVRLRLGFVCEDYAEARGGELVLLVPDPPFSFAATGLETLPDETEHPVQLFGRRVISTDFSVTIPDGFRVTSLPSALVIENPYLSAELHTSLRERTVLWSLSLQIKTERVSVSDYPLVRDALRDLNSSKCRTLLLRTD